MSGYHAAKILSRRIASQSVIVLDLEVPTLTSFQPGQWIDFMVPPYKWIGGFSPFSLPSELPNVSIAIKQSNHPPSQWVHSNESMEVGRAVQVQVGGKCVLSTLETSSSPDGGVLSKTQPVVFCVGGIGISPLLSMYRQWSHLQQQCLIDKDEGHVIPPSSFLYSVSTEDELVFQKELVETTTLLKSMEHTPTCTHNLKSSNSNSRSKHSLIFTITQSQEWKDDLKNEFERHGVQCKTGRFMKDFLQDANPTSSFHICGPSAMLDEGVELLQNRGVSKEHIHFERWW